MTDDLNNTEPKPERKKAAAIILAATAAVALLASSAGAADVATSFKLYRSVIGHPDQKMHFATFNSNGWGDGQYIEANRENCEAVARLFRATEPMGTVRWWCEMDVPEPTKRGLMARLVLWLVGE